MDNLFLINAPHSQKIKTVEAYKGTPLAYSNPNYYQPKIQLASAFEWVAVGDKVVLCSDSEFKFVAKVERIEMLTDATGSEKYDGKPVKILFGSVVGRFNRKIKVSTASNRFKNSDIEVPKLINSNIGGFKQGAFAEKLSEEQAKEILSWVA